MLVGLAARALAECPGGALFWIGRRCWLYPRALVRAPEALGVLKASVFVDPANHDERVWATDVASRCPGAAAVIADGAGIAMAESRRLQLAAAAGCTPALMARPANERGEISAARTRWLVEPTAGDARAHTWTVELLRCKGKQPDGARRWTVRHEHVTRYHCLEDHHAMDEWTAHAQPVDADVLDGSSPQTRAFTA